MEINGASNITSCYVYVWVMKGGEKSKSYVCMALHSGAPASALSIVKLSYSLVTQTKKAIGLLSREPQSSQ